MFLLDKALIPNDMWCVYAHHDLMGDLAYIGMGAPHRPFTRGRRSKKWHEVLGGGFYVSIISWHKTRKEAESEERALIKKLSPKVNFAHTGKVNPIFYGNKWNLFRKHTPEAKLKMSLAQKASWLKTKRTTGTRRPIRPIKCIETGIIYPSLRETARQTGINPSSISSQINGHKRVAGGYTFTREIKNVSQ